MMIHIEHGFAIHDYRTCFLQTVKSCCIVQSWIVQSPIPFTIQKNEYSHPSLLLLVKGMGDCTIHLEMLLVKGTHLEMCLVKGTHLNAFL